MRTSDFDYHLPPELIAQSPIEPRDSSRILVMRRDSGALEHRQFPDVLEYLRPGDVMVFNQSRVIPARLYGRRADTGSKVEFLLLRRNADGDWTAMARPGRRLRPGVVVDIERSPHSPFTEEGTEGGFQVRILEARDDGLKTIRLSSEEGIESFGVTPLPPYIKAVLDDPERYQTVYSRLPGSVAAPTAGLHFTDGLLEKVRAMGVESVFVTLHVGLDTFKPVDEDDPTEHKIHTERYQIDGQAAQTLNRAKAEGRRIIAVGTTSVRVLEQAGQDMERNGQTALSETEGEASIFILPGHRFRMVDAMITNFHLPRSSLLMLVSAFVEHGRAGDGPSTGPHDASGRLSTSSRSSGRDGVLAAYREAIGKGYRFYSFGDAMFIA
ncbi:MAG: tRNA preQ1(34) S-adenosylmethionine ribosyltransferase-isomerase QueA [Chloroflexi bacterium]|nr:tRNA preQ1(34) S-adenosylmethionine ribosyltransferase-isomerase QueA [Chloroflexota bacterium]MDA1271399.1 tRNA preQ1(34) S-adenosylmethionine ribosyltransferase-isomerase QueA [Chloroflexota bacterium]PKB58941.1 MAG: hypothetical protein BZY83_04100 [SAR202 cluster bacterium Casp-Chloro-G2]